MSHLFVGGTPSLPLDQLSGTSSVHSSPRASAAVGAEDAKSSTTSDNDVKSVEPEEDMTAQRANALNNEEFMEGVCDMVAEGNIPKITMYLNDGLSPNTQDFLKRPLLEVAVRRIAELYAKKKPTDAEKKTLRLVMQMIPLLLQRGGVWKDVDIYVRNELGEDDKLPDSVYEMLRRRDDMSPFSTAVARGNFPEAIKHIAKVEDLNRVPTNPEKYFKEGFTYLHIAVFEESSMLVQVLVQAGVRANVVDSKKRTPLHLLLVKCRDRKLRLTLAQFLLAGGASVKVACSYQKLIDDCKRRIEAIAPGSTQTTSTVPVGVDVVSRLSSDCDKYGTPLKLAESLGDAELLECMKNRRYLAVEKSALVEYIKHYALLQARIETAIAEGVCKLNDRIYLLYQRYHNVFLAFNPRHNYVSLLCKLQVDADVDRVKDTADIVERKMQKMFSVDAEYLIAYMQSGGARAKTLDKSLSVGVSGHGVSTEKTHANATFEWRIGDILIKCVNALEKHWFDVSSLIQQRATELYGEAVVEALCELIRTDEAHAVNTVLCRPFDHLFGNEINLSTIVDRKLKFTAIELAAFCGSINTLESLMAQQRNDITRKGLSNRTIAQIAVRGQQPLSLVSIDMFMFRNMMTEEPHTHAEDYGLLTEELENSVLHEAARTSRDDLMRHCIDQVRFQLTRRNKGNQTPLDVANQMIHWGMPTRRIEMAKMACKQIIQDAIDGKLFWKNSPSGGNTLRGSVNLGDSILMLGHDRISSIPAPAFPPPLDADATKKLHRPTQGRHRRPMPTMNFDADDAVPPEMILRPSDLMPPPSLTAGAANESDANYNDDGEMISLDSEKEEENNTSHYPIDECDEAVPTPRRCL